MTETRVERSLTEGRSEKMEHCTLQADDQEASPGFFFCEHTVCWRGVGTWVPRFRRDVEREEERGRGDSHASTVGRRGCAEMVCGLLRKKGRRDMGASVISLVSFRGTLVAQQGRCLGGKGGTRLPSAFPPARVLRFEFWLPVSGQALSQRQPPTIRQRTIGTWRTDGQNPISLPRCSDSPLTWQKTGTPALCFFLEVQEPRKRAGPFPSRFP